jgi:hypothetical protein
MEGQLFGDLALTISIAVAISIVADSRCCRRRSASL